MNPRHGRGPRDQDTARAKRGTISSGIPSVAKSYEGMTPKTKLVLALLGGKVTLAKPINESCKDFSTYTAATMENGIDIVPLLRDVLYPEVALEAKRFPVLNMLAPIDSSASSQYQAQHAAKENSYDNIYDREINLYSKRQWGLVDKTDQAMKLLWGQCTPALKQTVRYVHDYETHKDETEWLLKQLTETNSDINKKQKKHFTMYKGLQSLVNIRQKPNMSNTTYFE